MKNRILGVRVEGREFHGAVPDQEPKFQLSWQLHGTGWGNRLQSLQGVLLGFGVPNSFIPEPEDSKISTPLEARWLTFRQGCLERALASAVICWV